jgi:hypothetical protein
MSSKCYGSNILFYHRHYKHKDTKEYENGKDEEHMLKSTSSKE